MRLACVVTRHKKIMSALNIGSGWIVCNCRLALAWATTDIRRLLLLLPSVVPDFIQSTAVAAWWKKSLAFKENQEINHEASSIRGIELQQLSSVLLLLLFEIITLLRRDWKLSDHQAMSADRAFEGKMRL